MTALLDEDGYLDYLAHTHPELRIERSRLGVPTFVAPLDTREPLLPGFWRSLLHSVRNLTPEHVVPLSLFLGTPFERYDQTHLLDAIRDVDALAARARQEAEAGGLPLVVLTNVSPEHPRVAAWERAGFVSLPSFPDTVVDLPPSWDAHLSRLPPGDRSGIRRNIRRFEAAGHRLERLHRSREEQHALYEAYRPMYDRAKVRWQPHTPAYFGGLGELDERVHLTVARNDRGELIGFVVSFLDAPAEVGAVGPRPAGGGWQGGRVGVRADYHRRDAVYFRLLYHLVESAIALGGHRLSLEPTGYRMKRHLGARAVPLVNLVLGVSASWRMILSSLAPLGRRMLGHLDDLERLEDQY